MRFAVALVLLAGLTGCGPLFVPMVPRLEEEQQREVDRMWDNMLTPVQRVDRQTLLDANIAFMMFSYGVDRLHMTSEKNFSGGRAVMEIDCDRANPDVDQFTITILDDRGRTVRRERYTRAEVEESSRALQGMPNLLPITIQSTVTVQINESTTQPATRPTTMPATQQATTRPETPEERQWRLECERRWAAATAATQPARVGPATSGSGGPSNQTRKR